MGTLPNSYTYDLAEARRLHEDMGGYLIWAGQSPDLYAVMTEAEALDWGRTPEHLSSLAAYGWSEVGREGESTA